MLRKTKNKLRKLLGAVFPGSFIRIKGEGRIVVYKFPFSRTRFNLNDILTTVIYNKIKDKDLARCYVKSTNESIRSGLVAKAIDNAYDLYFESIRIQGKEEVPNKEKLDVYELTTNYIKRAYHNTKSLRKRTDITSTVVPFKETLSSTLSVSDEIILGAVTTGNEDFDRQFRQIQRFAA